MRVDVCARGTVVLFVLGPRVYSAHRGEIAHLALNEPSEKSRSQLA